MEGSVLWARDRGGSAGRRCREIGSIRSEGQFPSSLHSDSWKSPICRMEEGSDNTAQLCPPSKRRDLMGAGIFKGKQTNKVGVGF